MLISLILVEQNFYSKSVIFNKATGLWKLNAEAWRTHGKLPQPKIRSWNLQDMLVEKAPKGIQPKILLRYQLYYQYEK